MFKRKFTVVTQLHAANNADIIHYFETARGTYAQAVRQTFQLLKHTDNFNKSQYNTFLQERFGMTKRTANSVISDALGKFNALLELKKHELEQLHLKIQWFEDSLIPELEEKRLQNVGKLLQGRPVSLVKHRNLKRKLVAKKDKLNRMKQQVINLQYQIDSKDLRYCFGSKTLFQSSISNFRDQRDSQMSYIGSKTETACNQQLQLSYRPMNNQFAVKLRKDIGGFKTGDDKYAYGKVYFNHHKQTIINILAHQNSPLSYKIIKRNNRYYLYCTFEIQREKTSLITRSHHGVIGLDFNKGFVTATETNAYGHMIGYHRLSYRFKQGHATKTDIEGIANQIVKQAIENGKDIAIENLNFKATKSRTETRQGRKYNEMLHSLAYRLFVDSVERIAFRQGVWVNRVNPAWTSWIAREKYCPQMKLNVHIGASFVIARRGQGFSDRL